MGDGRAKEGRESDDDEKMSDVNVTEGRMCCKTAEGGPEKEM